MKLQDFYEMTRRFPNDMETAPFFEFPKDSVEEGEIDGMTVISYAYPSQPNRPVYGIRNSNGETICFTAFIRMQFVG